MMDEVSDVPDSREASPEQQIVQHRAKVSGVKSGLKLKSIRTVFDGIGEPHSPNPTVAQAIDAEAEAEDDIDESPDGEQPGTPTGSPREEVGADVAEYIEQQNAGSHEAMNAAMSNISLEVSPRNKLSSLEGSPRFSFESNGGSLDQAPAISSDGSGVADSEGGQGRIKAIAGSAAVAAKRVYDNRIAGTQLEEKVSDHVQRLKEQLASAKEAAKKYEEYKDWGKVQAAATKKHLAERAGWVQEQVKTKGPMFFLRKNIDGGLSAFDTALQEGMDLMDLPRREEITTTFIVREGDTVAWKFAVQAHDVGFKMMKRTMGDGGAAEEDVIPAMRVEASDMAEGTWVMETGGTIVLEWDNGYSMLRGKTIAMTAKVIKAPAE